MEAAIKTVVTVFVKSAKGKESLGGKDFQNLVKNHLKNILTGTESSEAVREMRQGLDANQDGKVSFEEYMKLVGYLATSLSQQRSTAKEAPVESAASAAETVSAEPESAAPATEEEPEKKVEEKKVEEKPEEEQPQAAATVEEGKEEGKAEAKEEEEKVEEAGKVEEVEEKPAAAAEGEEEKKTEEEAS